jgi:molybdopterin-guanine dinucleotide biosynthesis protein A
MFDILILAGGKGSRMQGADKGLVMFNNKPLIDYIHQIIKNYNTNIFISVNRNLDFYNNYGTVIVDNLENFKGPLAGISATLNYLKQNPTDNKYLLVLPVDVPFLTKNNIDKLIKNIENYDINVAFDGKKIHPTIMLLNKNLSQKIDDLLAKNERKLGKFIRENHYQKILVNDNNLVNINYKAQLQ